MNRESLIAQMKSCAVLLYQNEKERADKELQKLLPEINEVLQQRGVLKEYEELVVSCVSQFLTAYQRHDTLALADLLGNEIIQVII